MRSKGLILSLLLSFIPLLFQAQSTALPAPKLEKFSLPADLTADEYLPGRIYVKIKPEYRGLCQEQSVQVPGLPELLQLLGGQNLHKLFPRASVPRTQYNELGQRLADISTIYELEYTSGTNLEDAINLILMNPAVEYAEPHYVYKPLFNPNDPDTSKQYYIDQDNARKAWDIQKGDSTIAIGIIDTGTSYVHPDLDEKVLYNQNDTLDGIDNDNDGYIDNWRGWDFGGDSLGAPADPDASYDVSDHGVTVTGPAVAETNNGYCIASIGYKTSYIPLKATPSGSGNVVYGYEAVVYAADFGIPIVNLSWGGTRRTRFGDDILRYAGVNKGVLVVVAGGNFPADLRFFPATHPNVMGVAGSQNGNTVFLKSGSFGSTFNYLLDITAPARNLQTTAKNNICGGSGGWGSGTSLAAPQVCGAAALVLAEHPQLNNIQAGQMVRMSANDTFYTINAAAQYQEKFGRGSLDVYEALLNQTPSVRIADMSPQDGGNLSLRIGDTIEIRPKFVNYLDPTGSLTITLSTPNTSYLEIIDNSINVGVMGTLDTVSMIHSPFRVRVKSGSPANATAYLKFTYQDGNYDDYEYYPVQLEPSFVVLEENLVNTSVDSKGHFGYVNFPNNTAGRGFHYDGTLGSLSEGGFLVGVSSTRVSDNIRNTGGNAQEQDFVTVSDAQGMTPGPLADRQTEAVFNDNGAASKLDVEVSQRGYQYDTDPDRDYVIMEYEVTNTGSSTLTDVYAGIFADWDLGWNVNNYSRYDSAGQLVYTWEPLFTNTYYTTMGLVSGQNMNAYASNLTGFNFSTASKWNALTSPPTAATSADTSDIIQFVSAGPFTLAPGASERVAFFIAGGHSVQDLRDHAAQARDKWNCVILGDIPKVDLAPEPFTTCEGPTTVNLDAGPGYSSYLWNTGANTQSIQTSAAGEYWVEVTNGTGCVDKDKIEVVMGPNLDAGFLASSTSIFAGDTVWFTDTTSNTIGRGWDFGDGSTTFGMDSSLWHVFNTYGTYTVSLYAQSDCRCSDTATMTITVDTLVSVPEQLLEKNLVIFPNPTKDRLFVRMENAYLGDFSLRLMDIRGQVLQTREVSKNSLLHEESFDLNSLSSGLYFLELSSPEARRVYKIIRE